MTEAQIISVLGAGNMDTRTFIDDVVFISFGKEKIKSARNNFFANN